MSLGPLTFLAPLALLGLLALPIIWWILKVTPPLPREQLFPPLRILKDIVTEEETPNSTPLWLLLFRLFLIALLAIALAKPVLFKAEELSDRPLTLIIDDGWAAAPHWNLMMEEAEARIVDARRKNLPVRLIQTSDSHDLADNPWPLSDAEDILRTVKTLNPVAFSPNYQTLSQKLAYNINEDTINEDTEIIWLSSGIDVTDTNPLADYLSTFKHVTRLSPPHETLPLFPAQTEEIPSGFRSIWHRVDKTGIRSATITAHGQSGDIIARADLEFSPGSQRAETSFELPSEVRSKISALRIEGLNSAASVKLLDDSWGRPLVGILAPDTDTGSPLLSESFYAHAALKPYADVFVGSMEEILGISPTIIIMPDDARSVTPEMEEFVKSGGLLVRFAGSRLIKRSDTLLPVRLRAGGRALGGALTWEDPQKLGSFSEQSPFFGIQIPDDIRIKQQVMAEPGAETDAYTWARLEDGSPVVTSAPLGFGRIILFHVTAGPEWSNLPLSGLYIDMLRRVLSMARAKQNPSEASTSGDWAPERVLNGMGRLRSPSIEARPISDDKFAQTSVSRLHPPGFYRQGARRQALNIKVNPDTLKIMQTDGIPTRPYGEIRHHTLAGWLLGVALGLLALDGLFALLATGRLRHFTPIQKITPMILSGCFITLSLSLTPSKAMAQTNPSTELRNTETLNHDALTLKLAYVKTGQSHRDIMSQAAMQGLLEAVTNRTTIEPDGVRGIDPEIDPLRLYPFLYWPVSRDAPTLSDKAALNLNAFMASGGIIIFDTQDAGDQIGNLTHPGLARITVKLDIPELIQIPETHVLTKSFYLLQIFPGRWANGAVWVDRNANGIARDGVSSVIIGSNDWAAGWAISESGDYLQTLERDIPKQREMAYRFGVNLIMYALAGNYKSDQVHSATLIERIGRQRLEPQNLGSDEGSEP